MTSQNKEEKSHRKGKKSDDCCDSETILTPCNYKATVEGHLCHHSNHHCRCGDDIPGQPIGPDLPSRATLREQIAKNVHVSSKPFPGISPKYPFKTQTIKVLNSCLSYIDEGSGQVFLLLHGNPVWSYLWRNIIPSIKKIGRVIVPDLIGFGRSGQPDIEYTLDDHIQYLTAFINALNLKNIILVIHDYGSMVGLSWADQHRDDVIGVIMAEAVFIPPYVHDQSSFPNVGVPNPFPISSLDNPGVGEELIFGWNYFIEVTIPKLIVRQLSKQELKFYKKPFKCAPSRRPIIEVHHDLPIPPLNPRKLRALQLITDYTNWLKNAPIPKLVISATPGWLFTSSIVDRIGADFINTQVVNVGQGLHFIQEDQPVNISKAIVRWYKSIF